MSSAARLRRYALTPDYRRILAAARAGRPTAEDCARARALGVRVRYAAPPPLEGSGWYLEDAAEGTPLEGGPWQSNLEAWAELARRFL